MDLLKVPLVQRAKPSENVSSLPHRQAQFCELERDVFETKQRTCLGLMGLEDPLVQLEGRQRDAGLNAPLDLEELEVHIDGVAKLWLSLLQGAKLDCFSGLEAAGARRPSRSVGHGQIISRPMIS
jgi:hypothetical protein